MIKKLILVIITVIYSCNLFSHDINSRILNLREWKLSNTTVKASFMLYKNGMVVLENENSETIKLPISSFSKNDQVFINNRVKAIEALNTQLVIQKVNDQSKNNTNKIGLALLLITSILLVGYVLIRKNKWKYASYLLAVGLLSILYSFRTKALKLLSVNTNPLTIDSAFTPFKPNVNTFWNSTYFYVESIGIPTTHTMMVGISNHGWQQQVPIPQCYKGTNAWPIPLNPVMAASPIPVDSIHFTRGAIAIAANGVPIFNVHTNTGVDSYVDGQLDNYGGHCGRADDYHYHIAPLHLYGTTTNTLPIAYGLDGFAVYGSVEPNGIAMQTLDANHGHYGSSGVYHYHGTATAPYMIAKMAGQVTEDATHQLIPQAAASPVRTENWTPLNGALITSCVPNGTGNGYNLSYSLNNVPGYATNFSWNTSGVYTFTYVTPTGNTIKTYNGFVQCQMISGINEYNNSNGPSLYPNPATTNFHLKLNQNIDTKNITGLNIYNAEGKLIYSSDSYQENINISEFSKGIYHIEIKTTEKFYSQKLLIE